MDLAATDALIRILLSVLLGGIVGLERELSRHPAGLRTHILVCMGSAVFTILSISSVSLGPALLAQASTYGADLRLTQDPTRISAQIVTGIGFIGGGAVLRHGATVRGLTTAASLWMIASVGMLAGSGHYALSAIVTVVALAVLFGLGKVGLRLSGKRQRQFNRLRLLITANPMNSQDVQTWLDKRFGSRVLEIKTASAPEGPSTYTYVLDMTGAEIDVNQLSRQVNALTGVSSSGVRMYYHGADED
ncbi:MAG: MgtC/SapB family protein [Vampirovibrionales bacterium]|nr:MgtC/SapB family protein [Vampirovibrionales bacterium]